MPAPLLKPPEDGASLEAWEAYALQRHCYCGTWHKNPALYEKEGLPRGYCGMCERCGKPGHTRHFPGAVPYTGAWCDRCHLIVGLTWYFRTPLGWVYLAIAAALIAIVVRAILN